MSSVVLTPAQTPDIPTIHSIFTAAFATDSNTQLKNLINNRYPPTPDADTIAYHQSLIDHPRIEYIVARDTSTSSIVGYVAWGHRNFDISPEKLATADWTRATPSTPTIPTGQGLTVTDLENITSTSIKEWQDYFCPDNVRCRFIVGLCVHPDHQRKGIGRALMKWGTDKADQDGVYCWVQGSMGSQEAYERCGFGEVGRLELELDMFSGGRKREDGGDWGVYVWPYFRRDPVK